LIRVHIEHYQGKLRLRGGFPLDLAQHGAKPLFSDVSVKFGGGNRHGLIGANGCGKSDLNGAVLYE